MNRRNYDDKMKKAEIERKIAKEYPGFIPVTNDPLYKHIYVCEKNITENDTPIIIFLDVKDTVEIKFIQIRLNKQVFRYPRSKESYTFLLKEKLDSIKRLLVYNIKTEEFTSIAMYILSATFIHNNTNAFKDTSERPSIIIRHPPLWMEKDFKKLIVKITENIFNRKRYIIKDLPRKQYMMELVELDYRIIWNINQNCILGLVDSKRPDFSNSSQIKSWNNMLGLAYTSPSDTFLLFEVDNKTNQVSSLYISSNLIPSLDYQSGVSIDTYSENESDSQYMDKHDESNTDCIIRVEAHQIKEGVRLKELIMYTAGKVSDKNKLVKILAGIICAKIRFNLNGTILERLGNGHIANNFQIFCEKDWTDDVLKTDILLFWTKYITSQRDLTHSETFMYDPDIIYFSEDAENEDTEKIIKYDDYGYGIYLADIVYDDVEYTRMIRWLFDNNGMVQIFETATEWMNDSQFDQDSNIKPGNVWDFESHFSSNETFNTQPLQMIAHTLEIVFQNYERSHVDFQQTL